MRTDRAVVSGPSGQVRTGQSPREDARLHHAAGAESDRGVIRVENYVAGDNQIRLGVLLVPERALLASSIETVLGLQPDFAIVAVEPGSTAGGLRVLAAGADVVLIDDISLITVLRESRPDLKVIVLDAIGDPNMTLASIRAGAVACVSENSSPAALADVIRRVHAGEAVYEQRILLELVQRLNVAVPTQPRRTATLSDREREVLTTLATGASSSEAADLLCISLNTVRTHLKNILVKLEARSKLEAVIIALREGWIELPPESP